MAQVCSGGPNAQSSLRQVWTSLQSLEHTESITELLKEADLRALDRLETKSADSKQKSLPRAASLPAPRLRRCDSTHLRPLFELGTPEHLDSMCRTAEVELSRVPDLGTFGSQVFAQRFTMATSIMMGLLMRQLQGAMSSQQWSALESFQTGAKTEQGAQAHGCFGGTAAYFASLGQALSAVMFLWSLLEAMASAQRSVNGNRQLGKISAPKAKVCDQPVQKRRDPARRGPARRGPARPRFSPNPRACAKPRRRADISSRIDQITRRVDEPTHQVSEGPKEGEALVQTIRSKRIEHEVSNTTKVRGENRAAVQRIQADEIRAPAKNVIEAKEAERVDLEQAIEAPVIAAPVRNQIRIADSRSVLAQQRIEAETIEAQATNRIKVEDAEDVEVLQAIEAPTIKAPVLNDARVARSTSVDVAQRVKAARLAAPTLNRAVLKDASGSVRQSIEARSVEARAANRAVLRDVGAVQLAQRIRADKSLAPAQNSISARGAESIRAAQTVDIAQIQAPVDVDLKVKDAGVVHSRQVVTAEQIKAPAQPSSPDAPDVALRVDASEVDTLDAVQAMRVPTLQAPAAMTVDAVDVKTVVSRQALEADRIAPTIADAPQTLEAPQVQLTADVQRAETMEAHQAIEVRELKASAALDVRAADVAKIHSQQTIVAERIDAPVQVATQAERFETLRVDAKVQAERATGDVAMRVSASEGESVDIRMRGDLGKADAALVQAVELEDVRAGAVKLQGSARTGEVEATQAARVEGRLDEDLVVGMRMDAGRTDGTIRQSVDALRAEGPGRPQVALEVAGESNGEVRQTVVGAADGVLSAEADEAQVYQRASVGEFDMRARVKGEGAIRQDGGVYGARTMRAEGGASADMDAALIGSARMVAEDVASAELEGGIIGGTEMRAKGTSDVRMEASTFGASKMSVEGGNAHMEGGWFGESQQEYRGTDADEVVTQQASYDGDSAHVVRMGGGADRLDIEGNSDANRFHVDMGEGRDVAEIRMEGGDDRAVIEVSEGPDRIRIDGGGAWYNRGRDRADVQLNGHRARILDDDGKVLFSSQGWTERDTEIVMEDVERIRVLDGSRELHRHGYHKRR